MRKCITWLLFLAILASFCGCQEEKPSYQEPVNFYYRTVTPEDSIADPVIDILTAEGSGRMDDPIALLNDYLKGTHESGFVPTFPIGTRILSLKIINGVALIETTPALASLTGLDLTIACACLTMTVLDLTGVRSVTIRAEDTTLDGANQIVMDRNCLTMLDEYTPATTQK